MSYLPYQSTNVLVPMVMVIDCVSLGERKTALTRVAITIYHTKGVMEHGNVSHNEMNPVC